MWSWWLAPICLLCDAKSLPYNICTDCAADLPRPGHACVLCACPLESEGLLCGACLQKPPPWQRLYANFYYNELIAHGIRQFKFHDDLNFGRMFGHLLAEYLLPRYAQQAKPEVIIPVPLHKMRLRERGFNQAIELSRPVSKRLKIPLAYQACQRIKNTLPQSLSSEQIRMQNLRDAFRIDPNFSAQYVAVVDDVMTTGSTLISLVKALRRHGVQQIDVWCCAKTRWQ